jgi:transcriptional repressor NrdR
VRCPFCKEDSDKVIDSRSSEGGRVVRRRRQCLGCNRRFTTYERIEQSVKLTVVKKDGSRVPYTRDNIIAGVQKASFKRPVSMQQIESLAEEVEEEVFRQPGQEVSSKFIGEQTMKRLKQLDHVAYVRFASVYRDFQDVGQFINEAQEVMKKQQEPPGQQDLFESH